MKLQATFLLASALPALVAAPAPAASFDITVDAAKPTVSLGPNLYGLFFEDINYAADGGLYAELVQNRSFEYYAMEGSEKLKPLYAWETVERGGAQCELELGDVAPLNDKNPHYLQVRINEAGQGGVQNLGFDGIRLDAGAKYDVSLYARTLDWQGEGRVDVALELPDGTVAGATSFAGIGSGWKKFEGVIESSQTSDVGRLVVTTSGKGTLVLDMVSLFPQETWKGRKNGLRKDLVQALEDLNPAFLRFPGGCIAHGCGWDNRYNWKDSVGDVAERKPNWNRWGYHQTYGLGYYEYFLLCEDLGMQPLPVMPVGVSCGFTRPFDHVPMSEMGPVVQDVLDLIEFAKGPADSTWGSVRAKMGHPEPFAMDFICLGNEEHDTNEMRERFPLFVEAIRPKYPELRIIGTSGLGPGIPLYDLMTELDVYSSDEHYYESPEWFIANQHRFDEFDRSKPKIFIGEYASRDIRLFNALAEAAYLTGVERNADIVDMTCYAPLFANFNHMQWEPDLIYFNNRSVVRTPSYYVQQLFARNKGDVYLTNQVARDATGEPPTLSGHVGIGTWATAIEVESATVNGKPLDLSGWTSNRGDFEVVDGLFTQFDAEVKGAVSMSPGVFDGEEVTYTVRARKTGGAEGFLLAFGGTDAENTYWWNVGGWGNTRHAVERRKGGAGTRIAEARGQLESNRWYDLKVELTPGRIRCFIDGELVHDHGIEAPDISLSVTREHASGDIILKLVNPNYELMEAKVHLDGVESVDPEGTLTILTGDREAINSLEHPDRVKPETRTVEVATEFTQAVPAMSVQFIRIKAN